MFLLQCRPTASPTLRYRVPIGQARGELEIKGSRFIGTAGYAPTEAAARAFIAQLKTTYADATHNAWAFRIAEGCIGFSDDGEPGGSAGRPMLAILEGSHLEGSHLNEVVVVGTRYFGGTKLGVGGLVRAYGSVAREAVQRLDTAECVLHRSARITVDYALYGQLRYALPQQDVLIESESFEERVTLMLAVPYERAEAVAGWLQELSNGTIRLAETWVEDRYIVLK